MAKILIVDDEPTVINHVRSLLEQFGYTSDFIANPELLFAILEDERFDLLLLDINMPKQDGLSLLKELKNFPDYRDIPVIMLTGDDSEETLASCFDSGAVDFITKPIRELVLKARLKSALVAKEYGEQMEERIRERTEKLRVANEQLHFTISQQKQAETALQYSNRQLIQEIRDHEKTELALRGSEQRFRSLSNSAPIGIIHTTATGKCLYMNHRWANISGRTWAQTVGHHWGNILQPDVRDSVIQQWNLAVKEGNEFLKEIQISMDADHFRWAYFQSTPLMSENGELEGHVGILEDITERKKAEAAMLEKIRMEGELKTAAAVQNALLPKQLPNVANYELANYYQSASETGGDWHGVLTKVENFLFLLVGDVTGHGSPAALVAASASATCRTIEDLFESELSSSGSFLTPSKILEYVNASVYKAGHPLFLMTFLAIRIDLNDGNLLFSNAGHTFPILLRGNGEFHHLLNSNNCLGSQKTLTFSETSYTLEPGDTLVCYTDGLIELENSTGEMWGMRRLRRSMKQNSKDSVQPLVNHIVDEVHQFQNGNPLVDDITLLACRRRK